MEPVSARTHHRALTRYRPQRELFGWMVLLAITFGLLLAGLSEAKDAGDTLWANIFAALIGLVVGFYIQIARNWHRWVS